jgi:hypothetical protein
MSPNTSRRCRSLRTWMCWRNRSRARMNAIAT